MKTFDFFLSGIIFVLVVEVIICFIHPQPFVDFKALQLTPIGAR